jgi:3-isopropylmalate/(R)-2-methylmalate dehydratase small subunit
VAVSFADIFRTNCTKIGLLPVELNDKEVAWLIELAEADPDAIVEIDLDAQTVTAGGFAASFVIDAYTKWRLTNGLDDIGLTMQHTDDIARFEADRPPHLPRVS